MKHCFVPVALALVLAACSGDDDTTSTPAASASAHGRITNADTGAGVEGVTVSVGSASTVSDTDGNYVLAGIVPAESVLVNFAKTDFVPQSRSTFALEDEDSSTIINVPMLAVRVTETFDPTLDHTISVPGSTAMVMIPAGALQRNDGGEIVGQATGRVTPIAAASNVDLMPGNYLAGSGDGTAAMESFGALDASFVDASGAALNLATGTTATIHVAPSSRSGTLPDTMPLFYFDVTSGLWIEDGVADLVGSDDAAYYEGSVGHFTTWNCDRIYETIIIRGCVEDIDGNRIRGAVVRSEGKSYVGVATAPTDADGNFSVPAMLGGDAYVLAATSDGSQISNARQLSLGGDDYDLGEPCLQLTRAALSIKLTWGERPRDLDSHTLGANLDEHVYFSEKGDLAVAPFIALDVDDTSGFGPEVTSFSKLAQNRTYTFYVRNYSDTFDPGQTGSPARVDVTLEGQPTVFTPPAGESDATRYWHVFDVTTDANCQPTIVPRQVFLEDEPTSANPDNDATYCE